MVLVRNELNESNKPAGWINSHYVQNTCMYFLNGLLFYKKKSKLAFPIELCAIIYTLCFFDAALVCFYTDDLAIEYSAFHFFLHMMVLNLFTYDIIKHRKSMHQLNQELDMWFHYKHLSKENEQVRKEAQMECDKMTSPYVILLNVCNVLFGLSPLVNIISASDWSKKESFLLFPTYVPINSWVVFTLAYLMQVICNSTMFYIFARFTSYMITICVHINGQLKLLRYALMTIQERSKAITEENGFDLSTEVGSKEYFKTIQNEINVCIIHLQYLYKLSSDIVRILIPPITGAYTGGTWCICFTGVLLSTMYRETALMVKFFGLLTSELISLYMFSTASEYMISSFADTRNSVYFCPWYNLPVQSRKSLLVIMTTLGHVPSLKTFFGYKASMENLSILLNASYSYFTMIITTRK